MKTAHENNQINQLPIDLADMAERYSEALDKAQYAGPTFTPLRILSLLDEISNECPILSDITKVAIEKLPDSSDSDAAEAVLKGAVALNLKQASRIWDLVGLVLHYMQQHTAPVQASAPSSPQ